MKRMFLILAVLLLAAGISVILLVRGTATPGTGSLESWIGSQLQTIANSYLNPQLTFDDLDYQYPGTVTLKNLKLTADDPNSPGGKITILGASGATITLAEIPKVGRPIVIEKISLNQPSVAVIFDASTRSFVGFTNLIRSKETVAQTQPSSQPSSAPANKLMLSDYFKIKLIEFIDGRIIYDPRIAGTEAMELDKINTTLNIEPDASGLYRLNCSIAREALFNFVIDGKLDIDQFQAVDVHATLNASLSEDKLSFLPPQLQKVLRKYEARGTLSLDVAGNVPVFQPLKGDASVKLAVTDANLAIGDYHVPIDLLALTADYKDARVNLRELKIKAIEGEANLTGMTLLNETFDTTFRMDVSNMLLQKLLSAKLHGDPTQLKGRISAHVEATAPLAVLVAKWNTPHGQPATGLAQQSLRRDWGKAEVRVDEANLAILPTMQAMNAAVRGVTSLIGGDRAPNDKLSIDAVFSEDRVEMSDIKFVTNAWAARGKGVIRLDRTVDGLLNAGPIEKMQGMLGPVGDVLGAITDSVVGYRVSGVVGKPTISVEVGQKAVDTVKNVGEGVGKGIEKIGEGIFGK